MVGRGVVNHPKLSDFIYGHSLVLFSGNYFFKMSSNRQAINEVIRQSSGKQPNTHQSIVRLYNCNYFTHCAACETGSLFSLVLNME